MGEPAFYPIPAGALNQHVIVLGKTRSGKSSKMRLLVEGLLDDGKPVCVIDPKGDWWGLKSSADGKKAGYPVIIFGGEHADVPINEHSGAHIAELIATGNRPCIIDLGGWMVGARTRFFVDFASTLFKLTRGPRWLVIDECHNFAPQGKVLDPDAGKMLHWANRLASEGAGKGLTLISASQRPQKVHKDYVTSHETLIATRVIHPLDRGAIKDWIDGCADPQIGKDIITAIAGLHRSQAYVWSPEIGFGPELVTFPMFKTYDSFKAQDHDAPAALKGWATVDLDDVKTRLATVVEEARANDPKTLKAEIARLTKELSAKPAVAADPEVMRRAEVSAERAGYDRGYLAGIEEGERRGHAVGFMAAVGRARSFINDLANGEEALEVVKLLSEGKAAPAAAQRRAEPAPAPPLARPTPPVPRSAAPTIVGEVPSGCAKPLAALASVYPSGLTEPQWATVAGYKRTGGTWAAYKSRLKGAALIEQREGRWFATAAGAEASGDVEMPPAPGPDLVRWWAAKLPGTTKVAEALISVWPRELDRDELAAMIDMAPGGGSFAAYLSRLAGPGIIERSGRTVRLSEDAMGLP